MHTQEQLDELVARAQEGDEVALAELFESYRGRLGKMINLRMDGRLKARVAVSDVLQESFVDLAKQLDNYVKDPKLPFFLWLRRMTAQRLAKFHRDHLGRQKRSVIREVQQIVATPEASSIFMAEHLAGQFSTASEQAVRKETRLQTQKAIEELSETDREILALRHIESLTNQEIAIELEIAESAATNRYVRAIRRLRTALGE